jgi:hypothetical protein
METVMTMNPVYRKLVDESTRDVKRFGNPTWIYAPDGAEVYCYPRSNGRVSWGINRPGDGMNIIRAIRLPNGEDTCVMD